MGRARQNEHLHTVKYPWLNTTVPRRIKAIQGDRVYDLADGLTMLAPPLLMTWAGNCGFECEPYHHVILLVLWVTIFLCLNEAVDLALIGSTILPDCD